MNVFLKRYSKEVDGPLIWDAYLSPEYQEFFRRCPPTWNKEQCEDFENLTGSQLYIVYDLDSHEPFAMCSLAHFCTYTLSCQVGIIVFKDYQKKKKEGQPYSKLAMMEVADLLFLRMIFKKMKCLFLAKRKDIISMFEFYGFEKEGYFKDEIYFSGEWQDELEYALTKENYVRKHKNG